MVAQLVRQDDGSYDYVEIDTASKKTVAPDLTEFEAYEGAKKGGEDLVSEPSITEQTEKIQREIPSQVEFDAKTGTFITKKARTVDLEYKKPEITPESTEDTALQKVMKMSEQMRPEPVDYKQIMKDAYQATLPTFKEQALSTALDVGGNILTNYITKKMTGAAGDMAINYMTQNVLGKTMAGRLATGGMLTGTTINPYVAGASLLMDKKIGKKAIKTAKSVASSAWEAVTSVSVICTELCRQNLISKEDYKIHWNYTMNKWNKDELKGYWIWAMPTAKKMKTNKWLTKFWLHIMKYKIQHVKHTLGKAKFTLKGYIYNLLIEQISLLISKFIAKKKTKEVLV